MINRSGVSIYKTVLLGTRRIRHQRPTSDIIPGYHSMKLRLKVLEQTLCHTSSSITIPDDMLCIYDNTHPTYKSATGITRELLRICVGYARDWWEKTKPSFNDMRRAKCMKLRLNSCQDYRYDARCRCGLRTPYSNRTGIV